MGSSLPKHNAKEQKGQTKKRQKTKTKEKPKGKLHQTQLEKKKHNNLYDAWTISTHDACSNAVRKVQLYFKNYKIGLSIEFI